MNLKLNEQQEEVLLILNISIYKAALRLERVDWVKLVRDGIK